MQLASGTSGARACIRVDQHARLRRYRLLARIDHLHLAGAKLLGLGLGLGSGLGLGLGWGFGLDLAGAQLLGQPAQELGAPVVLDAGWADDERLVKG